MFGFFCSHFLMDFHLFLIPSKCHSDASKKSHLDLESFQKTEFLFCSKGAYKALSILHTCCIFLGDPGISSLSEGLV